MKADVYLSQIYWNRSLADFFFREQSYKTLEEFVNGSSLEASHMLDLLDERTEDSDIDDDLLEADIKEQGEVDEFLDNMGGIY
jgi:hypothetical protein